MSSMFRETFLNNVQLEHVTELTCVDPMRRRSSSTHRRATCWDGVARGTHAATHFLQRVDSRDYRKTTTMLFKMLGIERSWESYRETMPKPRQLFVTQSRVLAEKVEEYFTKLLESLATANQSPKELADLATRKKDQQQQGLVDRDEEIYWRGDLPKRYGALKEEHFPMFLTYDHVSNLYYHCCPLY